MKMMLTVEDVLQRKPFHSAKVLAGRKGLNRPVKWSHILEVNNAEEFVNGEELILTTGMNLQHGQKSQLAYIEKLIKLNTACICIELGSSILGIAQDALALAEMHDYPVIVFEETVKFVEITQDLHTAIINSHHEMLTDLDRLSTEFHSLSLQPNGIMKILQAVYQYFHKPVCFLSPDSIQYYPVNKKEAAFFIKELDLENRPYMEHNDDILLSAAVRMFDQVWGYIVLMEADQIHHDFSTLVLDRAATAISQVTLRYKELAEKKHCLEEDFIRSCLSNDSVDFNRFHSILPTYYANAAYRLLCIPTHQNQLSLMNSKADFQNTHTAMMLRTLLQKEGYSPIISVHPHEIICIIFSSPSNVNTNGQWEKLRVKLTQLCAKLLNGQLFGISSSYSSLELVTKAYEEANDVLHLRKQAEIISPFFDNLGIYRLLLPLQKTGALQRYIEDYIGGIIEYDKVNNSELLKTLAVYFECNGSRKMAAERLFIVRQTLYHRLEKLRSLLGDGFTEPTSRLALEAAIKGYELENSLRKKQENLLIHEGRN